MDIDQLIAIDTHTHAEVSCWNPYDKYGEEYDRAADKYFRSSRRPTIDESIAYYRERKIGMVMFTVDAETQLGRRRIPNEEIAEAAQKNSDLMIAFASVDPHKGKMGAREARRLIEENGVKGFKFHPTVQGFYAYDKMAWPIYEVIAEHKLPAIFHSGHSGIGSGMRCGGGLRLEYSNPMHLDDVAVDFPDMPIILAHPSFPWQEEALSVATHKPQVYIDLSGWSPKYFPPQLVQYANTLLRDKVLFGTDYPALTPERWLADFEKLEIKARQNPPVPGLRFALGTIKYPGSSRLGWLLYLKPTYQGTMERVDVRSYASTSLDFPHESTTDQWFSESQLESYRALGASIAEYVCSGAMGIAPDAKPAAMTFESLHEVASMLLSKETSKSESRGGSQSNPERPQ